MGDRLPYRPAGPERFQPADRCLRNNELALPIFGPGAFGRFVGGQIGKGIMSRQMMRPRCDRAVLSCVGEVFRPALSASFGVAIAWNAIAVFALPSQGSAAERDA